MSLKDFPKNYTAKTVLLFSLYLVPASILSILISALIENRVSPDPLSLTLGLLFAIPAFLLALRQTS